MSREPRFYVLRQGRIHYVMDRERGEAGGPGEAVIFYRHADEADRRAAELEAERVDKGAKR